MTGWEVEVCVRLGGVVVGWGDHWVRGGGWRDDHWVRSGGWREEQEGRSGWSPEY